MHDILIILVALEMHLLESCKQIDTFSIKVVSSDCQFDSSQMICGQYILYFNMNKLTPEYPLQFMQIYVKYLFSVAQTYPALWSFDGRSNCPSK